MGTGAIIGCLAFVLALGAALRLRTGLRRGTRTRIAVGDQDLVEDLVLANRMLASRELGIMDAYGHVSVRSRTNPNRYFIARYISAGAVTTDDIMENDLESNPVGGPRSDQYYERFIHGEVYKTRPDVMAVVHAHTPELVAFAQSSVPLQSPDGAPLPSWDIRRFNEGQPGIISSPELARSMAESLGRGSEILLFGHGVVITAASLHGVVNRADRLRKRAQIQIQTHAEGKRTSPDISRDAPPVPQPSVDAAVPERAGNEDENVERSWEHWKRQVETAIKNQTRRPRVWTPARQGVKDLILASRMLTRSELAISDSLGYVSLRNPANQGRFFLASGYPAGSTPAGSVSEYNLKNTDVNGIPVEQRQEFCIHSEIYKARPDVMAILHADTPELAAYAKSSVPLRPMVNGATFIGPDGPAVFRMQSSDGSGRKGIIDTAALGKSLTGVLGNKAAVLLQGNGVVVVDSSIYGLVPRAYFLRVNALIHQYAVLLGGQIHYLDPLPNGPIGSAPPLKAGERDWEYWKQLVSE